MTDGRSAGATLVYDDDCGFCSWWAAFLVRRTDLGVAGFSALTAAERERLPDDYEECVHLLTDDRVYSCGAAVEAALERSGLFPREARAFLGQFEDYAVLREWVYHEAADRRAIWGRFLSAEPPERRDPLAGERDGED